MLNWRVREQISSLCIRKPSTASAFRLIDEIRRHDMKVGLILNPETPVEAMKYYIHKADKITVMTVDPGFAGQPFIPEMLDKLAELKAWREREGLEYEIEVDGSCNQGNLRKTDGGRGRMSLSSALPACLIMRKISTKHGEL